MAQSLVPASHEKTVSLIHNSQCPRKAAPQEPGPWVVAVCALSTLHMPTQRGAQHRNAGAKPTWLECGREKHPAELTVKAVGPSSPARAPRTP